MNFYFKCISVVAIIFGFSNLAIAQKHLGHWVQIKATRIDGSRILDRSANVGTFQIIYEEIQTVFIDSAYYTGTIYKRVAVNALPQELRPESGALPSRVIDARADTLLVISQVHSIDEIDKKNRYTFLRYDRYVEGLKRDKLIPYLNDSTIVASELLFPWREEDGILGSLTAKWYEKLKPVSGAISGYFIINKNGTIGEVRIGTSRSFAKQKKLIELIKQMTGKWHLPIEGLHVKVPFTLAAVKDGRSLDIRFRENDFSYFERIPGGFTGPEYARMYASLDKGSKLMNEGDFKNAITHLTKVIDMDPLNVEVVYDRASCHFKVGNTELACRDWKYLKDLDQVKGTKLYNEHCAK
jgi:tetratricopeptide (TPR) repeat protein